MLEVREIHTFSGSQYGMAYIREGQKYRDYRVAEMAVGVCRKSAT